MTKFMSGASDIIAGVVCGSRALVASLMDLHTGEAPSLPLSCDWEETWGGACWRWQRGGGTAARESLAFLHPVVVLLRAQAR